MIKENVIRHNPDAIASSVIELICTDLKFRDKQNDEQYVMLNSKLKKQKKNEKLHYNAKKTQKHLIEKTQKRIDKKIYKSKFATKYKDRVSSIRQSDETTARNRKLAKASETMEKKPKKRKSKEME